ncbi:MAG: hypothetical protein AAFY88_10315, partial [Acidobacteriota bacterium]
DSPTGGSSDPVAVQERQNIRYELLGCSRATRIIECNFILTNNGADKDFHLSVSWGDGTYLFDQRGHKFSANRIRLADVEVTSRGAKKRMIAEIPVEAKIVFEGVPSAIEFVKVLHITTSDGDIEFRDIRFTK